MMKKWPETLYCTRRILSCSDEYAYQAYETNDAWYDTVSYIKTPGIDKLLLQSHEREKKLIETMRKLAEHLDILTIPAIYTMAGLDPLVPREGI